MDLELEESLSKGCSPGESRSFYSSIPINDRLGVPGWHKPQLLNSPPWSLFKRLVLLWKKKRRHPYVSTKLECRIGQSSPVLPPNARSMSVLFCVVMCDSKIDLCGSERRGVASTNHWLSFGPWRVDDVMDIIIMWIPNSDCSPPELKGGVLIFMFSSSD